MGEFKMPVLIKVEVNGVKYKCKSAACRDHGVDRNHARNFMAKFGVDLEHSINLIRKQRELKLRKAKNNSYYKQKSTVIDFFIYKMPIQKVM